MTGVHSATSTYGSTGMDSSTISGMDPVQMSKRGAQSEVDVVKGRAVQRNSPGVVAIDSSSPGVQAAMDMKKAEMHTGADSAVSAAQGMDNSAGAETGRSSPVPSARSIMAGGNGPSTSIIPDPPSSGRCISFETPSTDVPRHRLSVSRVSRPVPVEKEKEEKEKEKEKKKEDGSDVEEKNCAVDMPGDFFYMSSEPAAVTVPVVPSPPEDKPVFRKGECKEQRPPLSQLLPADDGKVHILLGASGSVASIKIPPIVDKLLEVYSGNVSIQLIVTKPAEHFLDGLRLSRKVTVWREEDAYADTPGDTLLFHELRRWADLLLVAPLSANTLAKLANGICNNLLTSVFRDWPAAGAPVLVAPAMNTLMYTNPMTKRHLAALERAFPFVEVLRPVEKVLMCGDIGMGGMREWSDIVEVVRLRIRDVNRTKDGQQDEEEDEEDDDDEDDEDEDENEQEEDDDDEDST